MSYTVLMDDGGGNFTSILDFDNPNKTLIEPKLNMEVSTIDSFEFIMPPTHQNYGLPKPLKTTVEVYEDDDGSDPSKCIWFGRVLTIETDYYRQKHITCEGALGWLNDIVCSYHPYGEQRLAILFSDILVNYYTQADQTRKILPGLVTVDSFLVNEQIEYDTTLNVVQKKCLDRTEGYILFRKNANGYYMDWLKNPAEDFPFVYSGNQPIEFGLNLIDLKSTFDGSDVFTAILPYGDTLRANNDPEYGDLIPDDDPRIGTPLTLPEPFFENKIITSNWVDQYGLIVKPVRFSGVKKVSELINKAQEYLNEYFYDRLTFEMSAVDLAHDPHRSDENYTPFRLGQNVKCQSKPHALVSPDGGYFVFPLLKLEIELDSATKTITVGTAPRKKITDYTLENASFDMNFEIDPKGLVLEIGKKVWDDVSGGWKTTWQRFLSGVFSIQTEEEPNSGDGTP